MIATFSRAVSSLLRLHPRLPAVSSCPSGQRSYSRLRDLSLFLHASREQAAKPDRPTYLLLLKSSTALPSHRLCLSVHGHALKFGFHADAFVATALVDTLSRLSDVDGARHLFDHMPDRDAAAWNAMLSGYARNGHAGRVLALFRQMGRSGTMPNSPTLSILLQACGGIDDKRLGRSIHAFLCKHPDLADIFLYNSLLVYYNKFGDLDVSESLFERLKGQDIVSWNAMISGYTKGGNPWKALEALHVLRKHFFRPDVVTLETALQACAQIGQEAIDDGKSIHALLVMLGYPMDVYATNSLLLMYCKCGTMESGWSVFTEMKARNIVSWNVVVGGYVRLGTAEKALVLFKSMRSVESEVSSDLFVSALHAVRLMKEHPKQVMSIHCLIIVLGFDRDVYATSSLIAVYGDCREVELARSCLDYLGTEGSSTLVCWNSMLSVYLHHGYYAEAVELIGVMQTVDAVTLVNALLICTKRLDLEMGKAIHGYVIRNKFDRNVFVTTSLLELYISCGVLCAACRLFSKAPHRNIVTWNTMIHGCLQNGSPRLSLQLFHLMQQQDGLLLDATSMVGVIEAIAERGCKFEGDYIHEYVARAGLVDDEFVANSLIAMYARFRDLDKAGKVFDDMHARVCKPSLVTWNTMMAGYSYGGQFGKAILFFHRMKLNDKAPDSITLLCLLRACGGLGSLNCVMWSHTIACKTGFESDVLVGTSLLDLYAKCGDLSMARMVFDRISSKTTISWNSMIQGYGIHGNADEAGWLFIQMQQSGLDPTDVTYLVLISACSHAGDAEKGRHYIDLMTRSNSFSLREEHLSSLVDLLGRNGLVKEAFDFLEKMPVDHGVCTWGALLGACRVQGDLEVGLAAAERLFELDPLHYGYNVLLSNMCAEAGRWMDASKIRSNVDKAGIEKFQGRSMAESFF